MDRNICQIFPLFLLNDTVHLLKSLRNNWLTSTCASLKLSADDESREVFSHFGIKLTSDSIARWSDIRSLYQEQKSSILKEAPSLTFRSVNPAPIERQKVSLALAVLNEKVAAALKCSSGQAIATAEVITLFVLFFKICNTSSKYEGFRLNDINRHPIEMSNDQRLKFLSCLGRVLHNSSASGN